MDSRTISNSTQSAGKLLKELEVGPFATLVSRLARGGSLQARKLSTGLIQFYWRYSLAGKTNREPIGPFDPTAPPKKLQPTSKGYSLAAAIDRCEALSKTHIERANSGGLEAAKREERETFAAAVRSKAAKGEQTLGKLLETYVAYLQTQGRRSHKDASNIFSNHVQGAWTKYWSMPAADLTSEHVLDMLRKLIEAGKGRTANKLRSYLRAAYQCALDVRSTASIPVAFKAFNVLYNPVAQTKREGKFDRADKRPLRREELRVYWGCIKSHPGLAGVALRLHLLTGGQRIEQLVKLRWREVIGDTITIFDGKGRPGGQGPRPHTLPLSRQAAKTLSSLSRVGEYVLSTNDGKSPISQSTLSNWGHEAIGGAIEDFQLKRIRSGIETLLAANGVSRDLRGHIQSHGQTGVQARHYDGHDYMTEKREALELLTRLLASTAAAGVIHNRARAKRALRSTTRTPV